MEEKFNSSDFVNGLSQELVSNFQKAGSSITPATIGAAREKAVRDKLAQLLPGSVDVGTGFVIDSYGNTSKQSDVLLYEKGICPIFSINNSSDTTFYPCESVLVVGEIKSVLDTNDLSDAFTKIESVKKCKRYCVDSLCWRKYCTNMTMMGTEKNSYVQERNFLDQIYGFILCQKLGLSIKTFLEKCKNEISRRDKHLLPNLIVSLEDGYAFFSNHQHDEFVPDAFGADSFSFVNDHNINFQFLLAQIHQIIVHGRTSASSPFKRYVLSSENSLFDEDKLTVSHVML